MGKANNPIGKEDNTQHQYWTGKPKCIQSDSISNPDYRHVQSGITSLLIFHHLEYPYYCLQGSGTRRIFSHTAGCIEELTMFRCRLAVSRKAELCIFYNLTIS
jgi:hypothetical protein